MTRAEFILARVADDEEMARAVAPLGFSVDMGGRRHDDRFTHGRLGYASEDGMPRSLPDGGASAHFARHDPARVLAQCAAYRRIVDEFTETAHWAEDPHCENPEAYRLRAGSMLEAMRILATIWADHPDFNPEWAM